MSGHAMLSLSLTFAWVATVCAHVIIPKGVTCGDQFNSASTALPIPDANRSWMTYRILTCDAPIFWAKAHAKEADQRLEFSANVPVVERFAPVRLSVVVIGPGLDDLPASSTVPQTVQDEIKSGEGAVLFESPDDQTTCSHLTNPWTRLEVGNWANIANETPVVKNDRCFYHETFQGSDMWVLLDAFLMTKAAGLHRFAVYASTETTAKFSFTCCHEQDDWAMPYEVPASTCPYCGAHDVPGRITTDNRRYTSMFYERDAFTNVQIPEFEKCLSGNVADPKGTQEHECDLPSDVQVDEGVVVTPETCYLECDHDGHCHSHNTQGGCVYDMQWIIPKPTTHGLNVTKMSIFLGDAIKFSHSSQPHHLHNLMQLQSAKQLADCDMVRNGNSEEILNVSQVEAGTAVTFDKTGTFYYSCLLVGHCEKGQRLTVDVVDPSQVVRTREAPMSCYQPLDVGGGGECGYMKIVKIHAEPGYTHDLTGGGHTPDMEITTPGFFTSPSKCQTLCAGSSLCSYWSFFPAGGGNGNFASCYLKADYPEATKKAQVDGECNPLFTPYRNTVTSGPRSCPPCLRKGMSVGGKKNECGSMVALKRIISDGGFPWSETDDFHGVLTMGKTTVEECQHYCAAQSDCSYFTHRIHNGDTECLLKRTYIHPHHDHDDGSCDPIYQPTDDPDTVSGPWRCPDTTCGALKEYYREMECCSKPEKVVPYLEDHDDVHRAVRRWIPIPHDHE